MYSHRMHKRVYFDYLDSLRFFAFFVVFVAHAAILFPISADWFYALYRSVISNGSYGVNFFFILSGFLISYLLLAEKKETGDVSIKTFYLKRVLRIWPLYYVVFAISILVLPIIVHWLGAEYVAGNLNTFPNLQTQTEGQIGSGSVDGIFSGGFWWFFLFVGNFYRAHDFGLTPFALGVLWSVCVEEQFYLFWPWVIKKLNHKGIFIFAAIVFCLSLIYKAFYINNANMAYYGTLSVAMDLAAGCVLGLFYFRFEKQVRGTWYFMTGSFKSLEEFRKRGIWLWNRVIRGIADFWQESKRVKRKFYFDIILGMVLIASISTYICMILLEGGNGLIYDTLRLLKRPVLDIFFIIILLAFLLRKPRELVESANTDINTSASAYKSEANTWYNRFTYLGRISYGLYAYHAIFLILVLATYNHFGVGPNEVSVFKFASIFVIAFTLTVIASHYSYKYMEGPCIRLRSRFMKK